MTTTWQVSLLIVSLVVPIKSFTIKKNKKRKLKWTAIEALMRNFIVDHRQCPPIVSHLNVVWSLAQTIMHLNVLLTISELLMKINTDKIIWTDRQMPIKRDSFKTSLSGKTKVFNRWQSSPSLKQLSLGVKKHILL